MAQQPFKSETQTQTKIQEKDEMVHIVLQKKPAALKNNRWFHNAFSWVKIYISLVYVDALSYTVCIL